MKTGRPRITLTRTLIPGELVIATARGLSSEPELVLGRDTVPIGPPLGGWFLLVGLLLWAHRSRGRIPSLLRVLKRSC